MPKKSDHQIPLTFPVPEQGQVQAAMMSMAVVKRLMKEQGKSRDQLADFMTEQRGRAVTTTTIDTWFCETKPWHWPDIPDLFLICKFLKSRDPLVPLIHAMGGRCITPDEASLLEVGRVFMDQKILEIKQEKLAEAVNGCIARLERAGQLNI